MLKEEHTLRMWVFENRVLTRIRLLILDLGTRCDEWSASCPDRALPPGKDPRHPLDRRQGGPQSWYETGARGKNSLPGIETRSSNLLSDIILTELPNFLRGSYCFHNQGDRTSETPIDLYEIIRRSIPETVICISGIHLCILSLHIQCPM
jgi:hypothetical protein